MTRHERLFALLAGKPADRPAVSFWRHFCPEEVTAEGLASAMLGFQREFDWDFMKVNPRAVYHVEDWGNTYEYARIPGENHRLTSHRIQRPEDWMALEPLRPERGVLGQHLEALSLIDKGLRGEVPYIMTVFNPISIAGHLAGGPQNLRKHFQEHPDAVHRGLEVITETFIRFARVCLERGACGIFFPTTIYASTETLTHDQYAAFGRPYDLRFLEAVQDAPCLLLHVCKSHCMLLDLMDYPVHAVNWSAHDPTNPGLEAVSTQTSRVLVGGVEQGETMTRAGIEEAASQACAALKAAENRPFILAPGCTIPHQSNPATLRSLREIVETFASSGP